MTAVSGIHHVALVCKDMKRTVDFYEKALGMELVCLIEMHGVAGAKHCFLKCGESELSFVEFANPRDGEAGVSFAKDMMSDSPITTQHHMALNASSMEELEAIRERIKEAGVRVSKPVDHGFCQSIYFDDPDGFHVEVTTTTRPYADEDLDRTLLDRKLTV